MYTFNLNYLLYLNRLNNVTIKKLFKYFWKDLNMRSDQMDSFHILYAHHNDGITYPAFMFNDHVIDKEQAIQFANEVAMKIENMTMKQIDELLKDSQ